jgi:ATP adenylyltransferase
MRMSHIYQPLLIRKLVDAHGQATLRQLAQSFLAEDESQLLFYERRIKQMPLKVLAKHGVVQAKNNLVSLTVPALTFQQKLEIRRLCEQRMLEFAQKKGLSLWDYRMADDSLVSDDVRLSLLKEASGRCALCGATKDERPLHVDHIIPRARWVVSMGDVNARSNLQILCSKCNCTKRDKDTTDFRKLVAPTVVDGCPFCADAFRKNLEGDMTTVFAVHDRYPVTPGHTLIIPKRHVESFFDMAELERQEATELARVIRNRLLESDPHIAGFNFGVNAGVAAGQTVMHCHLHLIPRRQGDVADPRGGIRGAVPAKMRYEPA